MTKIALTPNAAGTGIFTIEAPNSNTNRTITLPDAGGTILVGVLATQAQAETGTDNTTFMTPLRTSQTIAADITTQALAEAGADNATLMTPLRTEQHMNANDLGRGQTWQDVAASRVVSTAYQNTTARPIFVSVRLAATSVTFQVSADNVTWISVAAGSTTSATTVTAIVPVNHYYRVNGSVTINGWSELR
jgi:hypothetical protein